MTDHKVRPASRSKLVTRLTALLIAAAVPVTAMADTTLTMQQLMTMSIRELSQLEVTSVSKREQNLSAAPASIYVITRDEIHSSGATTIPEALRLAPNLHVARGDAGQYAISARGFNSALGNKLLVLIDGRTIYSPFFSGVFWVSQDILIEDIERIEVISGPGATLWGSNAVNGVINVITRPTRDTQGVLATANAGNNERGAGVRYGGTLGEKTSYRVYAKSMQMDTSEDLNGISIEDDFRRSQAGFHLDHTVAGEQFTLQGDTYSGRANQQEPGQTELSGGNMLGRYIQTLADGAQLRLQTYYDRSVRDSPGVYRNEMEIYDLELQHSLAKISRNSLIWGGGYREAQDETTNYQQVVLFLPENKRLRWWNFFVQDTLEITPEFDLIGGMKWEHNVYTGTEFLPNLRASWQLSPSDLLWAEVSRAVRAPSRLDRDFYLQPPGIPFFIINGGPDFESEVSDVGELGYRGRANDVFSYSLTAFYYDHEKQRSGEPDPSGLGSTVSNTIQGYTKGVEGWAHFQATQRLRLSGGFVISHMHLRNQSGSQDPTGPSALGNDPKRTATLRSTFAFNERHQASLSARYVSELPQPKHPAYTAVDAHYSWQATPKLEISVTLQNLFDPGHTEFGELGEAAEYQRSGLLRIIWLD
jgi:iron complex outermembrane receptor protein